METDPIPGSRRSPETHHSHSPTYNQPALWSKFPIENFNSKFYENVIKISFQTTCWVLHFVLRQMKEMSVLLLLMEYIMHECSMISIWHAWQEGGGSRVCERGAHIPVVISWVTGFSGVKKTVKLISTVHIYSPLLLLVIITHHSSIFHWRNSVLIIFQLKDYLSEPPWPARGCIPHFILYFQTYNQFHLQPGVQNVSCLSAREYLW